MIVFHTDLDNTIIYSYKHDIGPEKRNVEWYHEREISFITKRTYELLGEVKKEMMLVPTTTRTTEQYKRINLGVGALKYALVCNGGVLLVDGKSDDQWYRESLELVRESQGEIMRSISMLRDEPHRKFELRYIDKLFVFTKCDEPEHVVDRLKNALDNEMVDVFHNGEKVYVVPGTLNKGNALTRFKNKVGADFTIAAGDSEFDVSMIKSADLGLVPEGFCKRFTISGTVMEQSEHMVFSEWLLEQCLKSKCRRPAP